MALTDGALGAGIAVETAQDDVRLRRSRGTKGAVAELLDAAGCFRSMSETS